MARSKGFQGIVARRRATTWGTAVAGGAGHGIRVLNYDPGADLEAVDDRSISGRVTMPKQYQGNRAVGPSMSTYLRYEGNTIDLALLLGTAGVPTTVDTTAKKHVLKIADQIDGIFATHAYEFLKDTKVGEVPSVKSQRVTIRGDSDSKILTIECAYIGDDWKDNSGVNTTTTIDTVTVPTNNECALFKQLVMRLNAQGGAGLGSSDARHISKFELVIERNFRRVVSTEFGDKTSQPIESDFMKVSGSFNFPEVKDTSPGGGQALMNEQMTLTRYKADITITSPNLAGAATQAFQYVIYLPDLQLRMGKGAIPGPEGPEQMVNFEAHSVLAIPTGFPAGYIDAVTIENYNQDANDPLA